MLGLSALPTDHPLNKGMLGMHGNLGPNITFIGIDIRSQIAVHTQHTLSVSYTHLDVYKRQHQEREKGFCVVCVRTIKDRI